MSFNFSSTRFAITLTTFVAIASVSVSSFATLRGRSVFGLSQVVGLGYSGWYCAADSPNRGHLCLNAMLRGGQRDGSAADGNHTASSPPPPKAVVGTMDKDNAVPSGYCLVVDKFGCEAYENVTLISQNNEFTSQCSVSPEGPEIRDEDEIYRWIRLQAGPDKSLDGIQSRQDVLNKIGETIQVQQECGRADLYPRAWQEAKSSGLLGMLSPRRIIQPLLNNKRSDQAKEETYSFSVMQFNALAEGLCCGPNAQTPFPVPAKSEQKSRQKSNYGGFSKFSKSKDDPGKIVDFDLRRWRLLEVMLCQHNDDAALSSEEDTTANDSKESTTVGGDEEFKLFDLIASEELDRYGGFFAPMLALFGYQGIFLPKPRAPGARLGWYSDGCALFYRNDTFELIEEHSEHYRVGTQVFGVVILKHRASNRFMVVAVTHLKAQRSKANEQIRTAQISELLEHAEKIALRAADLQKEMANDHDDNNNDSQEVPILVLGDLNSDPPSVIGAGCVKRILKNHRSSSQSRRFFSAYPVDPPRNGFFTTWKTRGDDTVQRIIDYIFYTNKGLRCTHTLDMPDPQEIEKDGYLPGLRYPSDHMSIAARFELD